MDSLKNLNLKSSVTEFGVRGGKQKEMSYKGKWGKVMYLRNNAQWFEFHHAENKEH